MIDFFDRVYSMLSNNNVVLTKLRVYSVLRVITRTLANIFIPLYFFTTHNNTSHKINTDKPKKLRVVVSLTSYPPRVNRVWLTIESLLRQSEKPDRIILWLSKDQIPSKKSLPKKLLSLESRGLEIKLRGGDLKSHKKYYYAFLEFPACNIITVDDDVFYNTNTIANLLELNRRFPTKICCNHAVEILKNNGEVTPYRKWRATSKYFGPTSKIMPIGIGGVLYPPNSLYKDVLIKELFLELCNTADDVWLNAMARLNGTEVVRSDYFSKYLPVTTFKDSPLHNKNNLHGANDRQINNLIKYYRSNCINPF